MFQQIQVGDDTWVAQNELGPADVAVNLPPDGAMAMSFAIQVPADAPDGTYWVQATIDPEDLIPEEDETNNTRSPALAFGIEVQGRWVATVPVGVAWEAKR
jgi:hypothetical protein